MSRIQEKFNKLKERGEGALIGYLTLGDPDRETSKKLVKCLLENVDIMELGIPFSDPIADGPIIQGAIDRALAKGINTDDCFSIIEELRKEGEKTPFVFMTYYNIVLQYGEERFIKRCKETGVDGVLVSDLPIEEAEPVLEQCNKYGVDFIFLIAPTTTEDRIKRIVKKATGFLYLVSLLGVTGARDTLQEKTLDVTKWALNYTKDLPLAVGFGISKKEHVEAILEAGSQGVVVGSAFVKIIAEKGGDACEDLKALSKTLKDGTHR